MAGEVDPQSDVSLMGGRARTLHLKTLRKQWQIITLQVVSTIALVWMYLEVVSTYVVNSIDHTMLFASLEDLVGEIPIGDWLIVQAEPDLLASMFQSFWVLAWVVLWPSWRSNLPASNNASSLDSSSP